SYGFAGVWACKHLVGCSPLIASAGMLSCTTLLALPLAHWTEAPFTLSLSAPTWAAIAYAAILGTATAYLLYYRVLAAAGSGNLLVVTLLIPPVAILLGTAFLNEALPPRAYAGFGLLTLGLIVLDGRLLTRLHHKKPA
ncbi:MAG: DMT family transporter, partial [Pseudomonadota bacterium]|nr:DMT family transporter [Pseudomonadota bacterium]